MTARQQPAQQPPSPSLDLAGFPARTRAAGERWYRIHRSDQSPWWFSSDRGGRFDLPAPRGTCYLASSGAAAVRERVGPDLAAHGLVPAGLLHARVVSPLRLEDHVRAADVDSPRAALFRVTRELAVMTPYVVPQAWAAALAAAGFGAILTVLRFSPGRAAGLALFGGAGNRDSGEAGPAPLPARVVAARAGLLVVEPPSLEEITITTAPNVTTGGGDSPSG